MKLLAKRTSTKMKKKRMRLAEEVMMRYKMAQRQAKMAVIQRSMGNVDYKELPLQKEFRLTRRLLQRKEKLLIRLQRNFSEV